MRLQKITLLVLVAILLTNCASNYVRINPSKLEYASNFSESGVVLEYKYELLRKKYKKKETKKGVRLVALKITNNTERDLQFGKDIVLTNGDDKILEVLASEQTFKTLKQSAASYLWYLLLTPMKLFVSQGNGYQPQQNTDSYPIGFVVGPGLAGGNMLAVSSANGKFKKDLFENNVNEKIIKKGETVSGLVGIRTTEYNALKIKVN